jgi:hypothetical protein
MKFPVACLVLLAAACNSANSNPDREACGGACPIGSFCGADDVCHSNAPDTALVTMPPALGNQTTASFTFDATLAGATFTCRVDGEAPVPCTSPHEVTVGEGEHTFEVVASVDGLPDQTAAHWAWTVDLTPPDTTLSGPNLTNQTTVALEIAAGEAGARLECSADEGASWAACPTDGRFGPNAEGTHTVQARAIDPAGNVDPSPAVWSWRIDLTPPVVTIDDKPNLLTNSQSAGFEFSSNEPEGGSFRCQLDAGAEAGCETNLVYDDLAVGSHTFRVIAVDAAGNPSEPATYTWTIDTSSPDTIVDLAPNALTRNVSTRIEFHASLPGATFRCKLDSAPETDCTSPRVFDVAEGPHTYVITARSAAGVPDVDPARVTWTVDVTPPSAVDIDSPNTSVVASNDLEPTLSGDTDALTDVTVHRSSNCSGTAVAGRSNAAGRWTIDVGSTLAAAANTNTTYTAKATDAAGNFRCSAAFVYRTDTNGPAIARTSPDLSVPYRQLPRPTFGGTAEPGALVRIFRGGSCTGNVTAPVTATGGVWSVTLDANTEAPANGSTTYSAQAADATGNLTCHANFVYVTDNLAPSPFTRTSPDLTQTYRQRQPTFGGTTEASARVRVFRGAACTGPVTADSTAAGNGNWSVSLGASTEAVATGDTVYSAQARDAAGNSDCLEFTYKTDNTPPTAVDIDSPNTSSVPSNNLQPTLSGDTDANTDVALFRSADCTGASLSTRSNGVGRWSIAVGSTLAATANASTSYTARASDALGNERCSAVFTYTTDTLDPALNRTSPDLTRPWQTRRPTFGGTAEVNATVRVFRGAGCTGPSVGPQTASTGSWSLTLDAATEAPLDGSTTYSAQALDAAGNDTCQDFVYVTDNAAPTPLTQTTPNLSQTYKERRPTFGGATEANAKVQIFRGAACSGPATAESTAAANGTWSVATGATTEAVLTGNTSYSVQAKDAAGNTACLDFVYRTDNSGPKLEWDVDPPSAIVGQALIAKLHVTESPLNPSAVYLQVDETATVRCFVDDGTSQVVPDGGQASFGGLFFGSHDVECVAEDALGNTSSPLRTSIRFHSEKGGHVVLFGHDFENVVPANVDRMIGNAVLLANPPTSPRINVKTLRGPRVQAAEISRPMNAIVKATNDANRPIDATEIDLGGSLDPQLEGVQVLLIPDQNDPAWAATYFSAQKSALDAFMRSGGVIVILDGTIAKGLPSESKPSETYRLLVILGIMPADTRVSPLTQGEISVRDANVDPVAQLADGIYAPPQSTVTYAATNASGLGATTVARQNTVDGPPVVVHYTLPPPIWTERFDSWPTGWSEVTAGQDPSASSSLAFGLGTALQPPPNNVLSGFWRHAGPQTPAFGRRTRFWLNAAPGLAEVGFGADAGGASTLTVVMSGSGSLTLGFVLSDRAGYGDGSAISGTGQITRIPQGSWIQVEILVNDSGFVGAVFSTLEGRVLGSVASFATIPASRTGWALRLAGAPVVDFLHAVR